MHRTEQNEVELELKQIDLSFEKETLHGKFKKQICEQEKISPIKKLSLSSQFVSN